MATSDARIRAEVAEFLGSPHARPFSAQREAAGEAARDCLDLAWNALGRPLEELDEEGLRELLLERLPRRLARADPLAARAPELLRALLRFAHERRPQADSWKADALVDALEPAFPARLRELAGSDVAAPTAPLARPGAKLGRNDPCPCGSGRKFKKCCGAGG